MRAKMPRQVELAFQAEIDRLEREGKMPSLDRFLRVVAGARAKYKGKILAARREVETGRVN
jgi:hypothetical protein